MNWPSIHRAWKQSCEDARTDHRAGIKALRVQRRVPHYQRAPVDWWPKTELEARLKSSPQTVWPKTMAGTIHTAELLWEARDDVQRQQASFIAASLWDKKNCVPEHWRGEPYHLVEQTLRTLTDELEITRWYHSCREALPWSMDVSRLSPPDSIYELLAIVVVEYVVVQANWQLIKLSTDTDLREIR